MDNTTELLAIIKRMSNDILKLELRIKLLEEERGNNER